MPSTPAAPWSAAGKPPWAGAMPKSFTPPPATTPLPAPAAAPKAAVPPPAPPTSPAPPPTAPPPPAAPAGGGGGFSIPNPGQWLGQKAEGLIQDGIAGATQNTPPLASLTDSLGSFKPVADKALGGIQGMVQNNPAAFAQLSGALAPGLVRGLMATPVGLPALFAAYAGLSGGAPYAALHRGLGLPTPAPTPTPTPTPAPTPALAAAPVKQADAAPGSGPKAPATPMVPKVPEVSAPPAPKPPAPPPPPTPSVAPASVTKAAPPPAAPAPAASPNAPVPPVPPLAAPTPTPPATPRTLPAPQLPRPQTLEEFASSSPGGIQMDLTTPEGRSHAQMLYDHANADRAKRDASYGASRTAAGLPAQAPPSAIAPKPAAPVVGAETKPPVVDPYSVAEGKGPAAGSGGVRDVGVSGYEGHKVDSWADTRGNGAKDYGFLYDDPELRIRSGQAPAPDPRRPGPAAAPPAPPPAEPPTVGRGLTPLPGGRVAGLGETPTHLLSAFRPPDSAPLFPADHPIRQPMDFNRSPGQALLEGYNGLRRGVLAERQAAFDLARRWAEQVAKGKPFS